MLTKNIYMLALASLASAVAVPNDLADGVYIGNADGNIQRLPDVPAVPGAHPTQGTSRVRKRAEFPSSGVVCEAEAGAVTALDYEQARLSFQTQCGTGLMIDGKSYTFAKYGGAIWYMCNHAKNANPCRMDEIPIAAVQITDKCHGGLSGMFSIHSTLVLCSQALISLHCYGFTEAND
jgi:hypothetical protein